MLVCESQKNKITFNKLYWAYICMLFLLWIVLKPCCKCFCLLSFFLQFLCWKEFPYFWWSVWLCPVSFAFYWPCVPVRQLLMSLFWSFPQTIWLPMIFGSICEEWLSMCSQWTPGNPQVAPNSPWEVVKKIKSTVGRVKCSIWDQCFHWKKCPQCKLLL